MHILSCSILLKSVLLIWCVLDLKAEKQTNISTYLVSLRCSIFFSQNAGSQLCFRFFCFSHCSGQSSCAGAEGGYISVNTGNCHTGCGTAILYPLVPVGLDHGMTTTATTNRPVQPCEEQYPLKQTRSKDARGHGNVLNVWMFPFAGFVWLFFQ